MQKSSYTHEEMANDLITKTDDGLEVLEVSPAPTDAFPMEPKDNELSSVEIPS